MREETKESIRAGLQHLQELKKKDVNHTDCDWIFNEVKDMIVSAVKNNVSLSAIAKCIAKANTYTDGKEKKLKVTGAKLAVWLKANGIARKIHKRKVKKNVKKDVKSA